MFNIRIHELAISPTGCMYPITIMIIAIKDI